MPDEVPKLGPTGKFPNGKLSPDDEGEICFSVGAHNGHVIINFGHPVVWTAFPPDDALKFADAIKQKALGLIAGKT
jgi:hypothetical protein